MYGGFHPKSNIHSPEPFSEADGRLKRMKKEIQTSTPAEERAGRWDLVNIKATVLDEI